MILVCPSCHRSYVYDDAEIALRGGPSAYKCDECSHELATMAEAMGIKLQDNDTATVDPGMTLDGSGDAAFGGPGASFESAETSFERSEETFDSAETSTESAEGSFGGDDTATEVRPAFSGESIVRQSGSSGTAPLVHAVDLPPGQLVVGAGSQSHSANLQAPPAERPRLSGRITGQHSTIAGPELPPPASTKPTAPMDNDRYAATSAAQPALHRQSATPSRPVPKRGGAGPTAALAVGCLLFILLIAFLGAGGAALYVVSGSRDSDAGTEGKKDGPAARRPLEDRMREASGSEPDTAVPTVALGMPLQDGEVVFVAPSAVLHNQETLATVSMGRVAVAAKPNADSPLVLPLARSLEAAFAKEFSDPLDAENAIRWVVVLVDGKVGYRTVFEVLYTCWERGARMQLAATNPTNPNSYVAVEVMADGWPSPERAGSPDDLPRRVEEAMDSKSNALTVKITDKGFLLWAPGEKENEAVKLDRLTAYPTSQLQKYSAALQRDPRIRAMRVRATEDTSLFVVLQAIAAVTGAKSEPQVTEVRLVPPEKD